MGWEVLDDLEPECLRGALLMLDFPDAMVDLTDPLAGFYLLSALVALGRVFVVHGLKIYISFLLNALEGTHETICGLVPSTIPRRLSCAESFGME
jgi:hypothetical protein